MHCRTGKFVPLEDQFLHLRKVSRNREQNPQANETNLAAYVKKIHLLQEHILSSGVHSCNKEAFQIKTASIIILSPSTVCLHHHPFPPMMCVKLLTYHT